MGAIDTAKEIIRLGNTAGLSKDVIDLLEKKAALLTEQVAALEQENRNLKLENESLKNQLPYTKPKEGLGEQTALILKYYFAKADNGASNREIAHTFKMTMSMAAYHTDILWKKGFIGANQIGDGDYAIRAVGRAYCVENGLVS